MYGCANRIYFENQTVRGSINLEGGMIDDLELKKYDLVLIDRNQKKSKFITKKLNFYQFSRLVVGKMVSLSCSKRR